MSTSECSMNYLIPIWLVVGGCGGIVSEFFASAILIYSFFRAFHHRSFTEKLIHIFLFVVPFVLIVVFNLAWFFTGIYNSRKLKIFIDTIKSLNSRQNNT